MVFEDIEKQTIESMARQPVEQLKTASVRHFGLEK